MRRPTSENFLFQFRIPSTLKLICDNHHGVSVLAMTGS